MAKHQRFRKWLVVWPVIIVPADKIRGLLRQSESTEDPVRIINSRTRNGNPKHVYVVEDDDIYYSFKAGRLYQGSKPYPEQELRNKYGPEVWVSYQDIKASVPPADKRKPRISRRQKKVTTKVRATDSTDRASGGARIVGDLLVTAACLLLLIVAGLFAFDAPAGIVMLVVFVMFVVFVIWWLVTIAMEPEKSETTTATVKSNTKDADSA